MKLTELEMKTLLKIPLVYDILLSKMRIENIRSDERRKEIEDYAERLRFDMGA